MEFIINEEKWRTGGFGKKKTGKGPTQLINKEGFQCCLGFCLLQLEIPKKLLMGQTSPDEIFFPLDEDEQMDIKDNPFAVQKYPMDWRNTVLTSEAIDINDDTSTTIQEKKKLLKFLFKEHGHNIIFE